VRKQIVRVLAIMSLAGVLIGARSTDAAVDRDPPSKTPFNAVEGLWAYTSIKSPGGKDIKLTGVILFKDGTFAQQSIFDGKPFEQQMAMAHAGPYTAEPMGLHLIAQQTIAISPDKTPALSFRKDTQHDISVDRHGNELTLVFKSGTIQKFKRIGPAHGELHTLDHGVLAFIDGRFLLVDGDEKGVVSGYGGFTHVGPAYDLKITRWAETSGSKVSYLKDSVMKATFDGSTLTLADGRTFRVTK
jgi:hypothetical protein